MYDVDAVSLQIAQLQQKLAEGTPDYVVALSQIHKTLKEEPELIHLLKTDTELSVVIDALKKYQKIEIPITEKKKNNIPKGPITLDAF